MASQVEQVAATQQRQNLPKEWLMEFDDWANSTLQGFADDERVNKDWRAYARWELEYRRAFGHVALLHPETGALLRVNTRDTAAAAAAFAEIEAAEARVKARAAEIRARKR